MVNATPLQELLDPNTVKAVLGEYFPGLRFDKSERIGGMVFTGELWQFVLEFSVTTTLVTFRDHQGMTWITFKQNTPRGEHLIMQTEVNFRHQLEEKLDSIRSHLKGVIAALTIPFEDPPPVNIFGGGDG